ncbi:hypothetical protein NliqN6_5065 [Naganishia liquefaciens]|uniref:BZIP domain-containing protein n=1 Tax=Naganishia liquefaciens TaxID=104408 RepID=A0A8H3TX20_9TREE|nr:hypothetical protein NliqN6_5065 [Naganishia liquefaciens]
MASYSSPQQSKITPMEANEPSGSTTRSAAHRRKSSTNLPKTPSIAIKPKPKPSRSQGESSAKRKEQNRIAQRAFRKRQKAHLEELEAEVIEKGMRIKDITENNGLLLETMKQLQSQNVELKSSLASNMPGSLQPALQPHVNPTGTPPTAGSSMSHSLPESRHPPRRSPALRSENNWSSSTDSPGSNVSTEATSPQNLQSTSFGSDSAIGSLTGLQLNTTLSSGRHPHLHQSGSHLQQDFASGTSTTSGQMYSPYPDPQQWTMENSPESLRRHSYMNGGGSGIAPRCSAGNQNMPLVSRPQNVPGPMARRFSDAVTRRHKHSMSTPHRYGGADLRPHSSISIGHPNSKIPYHQHSYSVPNSALLITAGSPQMVYNATLEPLSTTTTFPAMATPEEMLFAQSDQQSHVMYQQSAACSSSSSSNVGWSFSPLSQSASLTDVDHSTGDHSASSTSYFSTLSLQPSTHSTMTADDLQSQMDTQAIASGTLSTHWADMMPSMGVTTPLQDHPDSCPGDSVMRPNSATVDIPNPPLSESDSPFLPETGIFTMNSTDIIADLTFSPFVTDLILESPAE